MWQASGEWRVVSCGVRKVRVSGGEEERRTEKNGRSGGREKRAKRVEKRNGGSKAVRRDENGRL